ncbi:MAG: PLP-dependent aminotransferase family protein, partial [Gammaproteobacteria bacterium]|nr:PLP-dependent aminotransferase family protein [Gammaproteobacteria bacterium]
VFTRSGDTVFVEDPSYFLAFKIFRDHDLNVVGIPVDKDGMRIDALENALNETSPAILYTIPSYHNPGGFCTSEARRHEIVRLADAHDFLIVADEVYQLLHFFDPPPPAYGTMIVSDRVLSLGSFSKLLAPGMRLGWVQTSRRLREKLLANGFVNSGGSINHLGSHIVRHAIELGLLDKNVLQLRQALRQRLEAMNSALNKHFNGAATWLCPEGGYFFWLQLDSEIDTEEFRARAADSETGFQPGRVFSSSGQLSNCMRLCFAHYSPVDIESGMSRLRAALDID